MEKNLAKSVILHGEKTKEESKEQHLRSITDEVSYRVNS